MSHGNRNTKRTHMCISVCRRTTRRGTRQSTDSPEDQGESSASESLVARVHTARNTVHSQCAIFHLPKMSRPSPPQTSTFRAVPTHLHHDTGALLHLLARPRLDGLLDVIVDGAHELGDIVRFRSVRNDFLSKVLIRRMQRQREVHTRVVVREPLDEGRNAHLRRGKSVHTSCDTSEKRSERTIPGGRKRATAYARTSRHVTRSTPEPHR